ncbi:MAG: hypothetical protein LYZ69_05125 [Nitrososphaerales archaeon]|nr:hypothetical protein [Nitrososphaerales archaeon]
MSEEIVEEQFKSAVEKVEAANHEAVAEVRAKVEKAKSEALSKLKP